MLTTIMISSNVKADRFVRFLISFSKDMQQLVSVQLTPKARHRTSPSDGGLSELMVGL
jgi:hypothetical protein